MGRIRALFDVEPGEAALVGSVSLIFFLLQSTHALTANAADALFFTRFGVEFLPGMYTALGLLAVVTLLGYALGLGAWPRYLFYPGTLIVAAIAMVALNRAVALDTRWVYAAIWLVASLEILVTFTMMWNVAGDGVDARSGKRLFPLFASAGILGGVVGNLATGPLARAIGTENILLVAAVILLIAAVLVSVNARRHGRVAADNSLGAVQQLRDGYRVVRSTPLLRRLAVAMALASVLFYTVAFPFSAAVADSFETETAIASYLGLFAALATSVTFLVSLFVADRLFRRIGIVASILLVALAYVAGFGLWLLSFGLVTASIVRLSQWVTSQGIGGTARTAVFDVVRGDRRGSVMAFMFAVPLQLRITLAGLTLWAAEAWLTRTQLFLIGFAVSVLYAYVVWSMRSRYLEALVSALQAGAADVFLGVDRSVTSTRANAETIEVLRSALASDRSETKSAALEVAAAAEATTLLPEAEDCLSDPDLSVQVAAAQAVLDLGGDLPDGIAGGLAPEGRSADHFAAATPSIRGRAAVVLADIGRGDEAAAIVADLLNSEEAAARMAGVAATARMATPAGLATLEEMAGDDPSPAVRRVATEAISSSSEPRLDVLFSGLRDESAQVRRAAADGWPKTGAASDRLLGMVETEPPRTKEAALIALGGSAPDGRSAAQSVVAPFLEEAAAESGAARALASLGLEGHIESAEFLADLYERRSWERQRVATRTLPIDPNEADLILDGLESSDADLRAQALEALDTVAADAFGRRLVGVVEGGGDAMGIDDALARAIRDEDEWIRALAIRCIEDRVKAHWSDAARLSSDPSLMVRRAAAPLLAMMEENMSGSLDLLGPAERVVALRRVPLFSSLEPADLNRIAEAAEEQTYPKGTRLFSEGESGSDMCVVLEGSLDVTRETDEGTERFNTYGPGDHVGELAVLRHASRTADVTATSDVRVLIIDGDTVGSLLVERPEVARSMLASLAERLAVLSATASPHPRT